MQNLEFLKKINMKKPALFISILIILVIFLSVVKTFISNNVSTSGVLLGKAEEQISNYKLENTLLEEKLYTESSLTTIAIKADKLGYTDKKTDFVLTNQYPVAYKQ